MKQYLLSVLSILITTAAFAQLVQTQYGYVQGTATGQVYQYLGIPFASPPVGNLRWKAPAVPAAWTDTLAATAFAPVCPQKKYNQGDTTYTLEGNEDCLYLNIWTPQQANNLPVMVFIHGGGNQQGSASEVSGGTQLYNGKNMAERGNVIVITIQYRLGALGYMVHPGLEAEDPNGRAGNYGVMDQLLALQWIQNNIAQFGGNPNNVMIFGESAGGVNVGNLLVSPLAQGLFHKACIQSAAPNISSLNDAKNKGIQFVATYANATGTDAQKIGYMRTLPADSITIKGEAPLQGGLVQMAWQPTLDNYVFTALPTQAFQSGNFNKVPLMIGSNSEEMSLSAPLTLTPATVNLFVAGTIPQAYQDDVLALYPPGNTNAQARAAYIGIVSDGQFTTPVRRTARCVSNNQTEPVWRYFFTFKHTIPQLQAFGSYHGMELFYVFNNWENATLGQGVLFKPADDSVQKAMLNYWVNFAYTGNPNGSGLPNWPSYTPNTADCYLEIKATPNGTQCGVLTNKCNLWDQITNFTACVPTAVEEVEFDNAVQVFPNPASTAVTITLPQLTGNAQVCIYDVTGRPVLSQPVTSTNMNIPLTGLTNGIYLLRIVGQGQSISQRLVIAQ